MLSGRLPYTRGERGHYLNGMLHREDGPAIEYANGDKEWYQNGQLHREDGPAREWFNCHKQWWYRGKLLDCRTQEEFESLMKMKAFW